MSLLSIIVVATLASAADAPLQVSGVIQIVATPGIVPSSITADEIVAKVQSFYANVHHVTAAFRQTVTNKTFGTTTTMGGVVWIMRPGRMRWDYHALRRGTKKITKSFISNGSYLYVVEYDNLQVIKKNLARDVMPVAVSFLYGKGDLRSGFDAELDLTQKYGSKGDYVLRLLPKKASAQFSALVLVVDPGSFQVKQSIVIDSSRNVNAFRFLNPDFRRPVKASWFELDEKSPRLKSFRVVDADAPPPPRQ